MGDRIGYARVSTADQDPQLQLDALSAAECLKVYTDTATGTKADRPQWNACLADLRRGDTLIFWKIDRLGRNLRDLIDIVTTLQTRGVGVRSLTNGIVDTTTAHGSFVFSIFALMAEYEAALIKERTQAGLIAALVARQPELAEPATRPTEAGAHCGIRVGSASSASTTSVPASVSMLCVSVRSVRPPPVRSASSMGSCPGVVLASVTPRLCHRTSAGFPCSDQAGQPFRPN